MLEFEALKQVLLALETKVRYSDIQLPLEKLNLKDVRLRDDDVNDLLHYLRDFHRLLQIDLSSVYCELSSSESSSGAKGPSSRPNRKQEKLTTLALVRLFVGLQRTQSGIRKSGNNQEQGVSLSVDGRPVGWRQACEWVAGRDSELHAELVTVSHTYLLKQFTNALEGVSVNMQSLEQMFESVLCVSDIRWPYALLNAFLLSGLHQNDRETLVGTFKEALEWIAQHAMINKSSVADLKAVLRSALRHRLLNQREFDTLAASAMVSSVFSDERFRSLAKQVNSLSEHLGALELHLKREFAKLESRQTNVEKRVSRFEINVNAVAQDLTRLREALRNKQRRDAAFEALKVREITQYTQK